MSDSDESDVVPIKRKRRYNINESEESSSGSDSSVIIGPSKRPKKRLYDSSSDSDSDLPIRKHSAKGPRALESETNSSESSDWQSDWSSEDTEVLIQKINHNPTSKPETNIYEGSSSDSGDEHTEKCPICLLKLSKQEIATPESCDHLFCFECLQEWSKNVSTCPIDRKEFKIMLVRANYHSTEKREVKVVQNKQVLEEEILEDTTFCEICRHSDREDSMLLCDGCDCGFHMECLTPRLEQVPLGDWFCDSCAESNNSTTDEADRDLHSTRNGIQNDNARLIPRTMQSERVRITVENLRDRARRYTLIDIFDPDQPSTSSGFVSTEHLTSKAKPKSTTRTSRKSTTKKRVTKRSKRRKPVKRRKYITEYEICQKTGAKIQVRKLVSSTGRKTTKRSGKRKVRRTRKKTRSSKSKTKSSRSKKSSSSMLEKDSDHMKIMAPSLHLFGRRDELDYFSDDSVAEQPTSSKAIIIKKTVPKTSFCNERNLKTANSSISILDSIMESQEQWHSKKSQLAVERDGKLIIKNK